MKKSDRRLIALFIVFFGQIILPLSEKSFSSIEKRHESTHSVARSLTNEMSSFAGMSQSEALIDEFMDEWGIAGASVAITKDERLIYAKGFGYADTSTRKLVEPKHLFRVASVSKLITAVAIMKLVEQEKLSLNDKVFGEEGVLNSSNYQNIRNSRITDITVRHLLCHKAGWSQFHGDPIFSPYTIINAMDVPLPIDLETTIEYTLKHRELSFDPGTKSSYSNFGYALLGIVIEEVTNMNYEQYVSSEILNPAGIYDMQIGSSRLDERKKNEVKYYSNSKYKNAFSSFTRGKIVPRQYGGNNFDLLGAAGAWLASPTELMKLLVHIDRKPSKQDILSESTINKMIQVKGNGHPIGWMSVNSKDIWKRTGTLTGTSALLKRCSDGIAWTILVNTNNDLGPDFTYNLDTLMSNVVDNVSEWPDYDLFYYNKPKSLFAF
ncbi:MAG: serine hydrolase domain-containing protein [Bacteroidales bacterium]